jgi:hypothetical protein
MAMPAAFVTVLAFYSTANSSMALKRKSDSLVSGERVPNFSSSGRAEARAAQQVVRPIEKVDNGARRV